MDEKRDSKYPAFRRLDATKWRKWKFYIGAITILPLRLILTLFLLICCYLSARILSIGHNYAANKPMGRYRYALLTCIFQTLCAALMMSLTMRSSKKKIEYDYSEYLGADYKEHMVLPKYVSTILVNHSTWIDITILKRYFRMAYISKEEIRDVPIMGIMSQAIGCMYI